MNLAADLLRVGVPDAVAIVHGDVEFTYQELHREVEALARTLLVHGVRQPDRVAIWSENSIFFIVAYLAVIRAGLVAVPIQADAAPEPAELLLRDAGVRILLTSPRCERHARRAAAPGMVVLSEAELVRQPERFEGQLPDAAPGDLATLMFTSGSTGVPKGVMVTHGNIQCNTSDIVDYLGLTSNDRCLVVLPFSYCFGLSLLHTHLAVGGSVVINNQFRYPEAVLRDLDARSCTGFAGVPSTYQLLVRNSRFTRLSFPSLRWLQQAGGWLPDATVREITSAFPAVRFFVMYGQTEATARLSYLPPERLADKPGSVGRGLRSSRLEVLRDDGTPVQPGSGEIGEIVASGDNVTLGYWNDPQETSRYFRSGRLYTGDLARVDADGFIYLVDRERDIIKAGGNRISAKEIECVVSESRAVAEVAVVGAPHDVLGEAIVAFVTMDASFESTPNSVLDHCRLRLPASKVPTAVVHLARLPQNGSGKVLRGDLRKLAAQIIESRSDEIHDDRVLWIERGPMSRLPEAAGSR